MRKKVPRERGDGGEDVMDEKRPGNKCLRFLKNNWFILATILGVGIGFAIAFGIRASKPSKMVITWITMPGDIYLRILQLTILPLIASNILVVIATLEPKKNGAISIIGIVFIICGNMVGSLIGTASAAVIQPGSRSFLNGERPNRTLVGSGLTASDIFRDIFLNFFPDNIFGVTIFQYRTEVLNYTSMEKVGNSRFPGTNMIGVLFCAIVFGAATKAAGKYGKPFLKFFRSLATIVTKLMSSFLLLTPIGVCFMVAGSVVDRDNIQSDFIQLGLFVATVLVGLGIYFFLLLLVFFLASWKNPLRLLKYSIEPFLISFATTSTAVAMTEMYEGLDAFGCDKMASRFVVPVSAALKGDGPAIFITSACMFVAQQSGVELDAGKIVFIILLTFVSSLAVPNIPSASVVLIVTVLSSIGVPTEAAAILFAMEWLLDRCRSGLSGISVMYLAATTSAIHKRMQDKRLLGEDTEFSDSGSSPFEDQDDSSYPSGMPDDGPV